MASTFRVQCVQPFSLTTSPSQQLNDLGLLEYQPWCHVCNSVWSVPWRTEVPGGPFPFLSRGELRRRSAQWCDNPGLCWLWAPPPTFQPLLPERHHLVELPLDQPICLLLIQPAAAREGLLDASEGAQNHHLGEQITSPTVGPLAGTSL